jgi:hypothetical protein
LVDSLGCEPRGVAGPNPVEQQALGALLLVPSGLADGQPGTVRVRDPKEKGSDVNLATWLLVDGFRKDYEAAVVFSNDSDLCLPIAIVTQELKLPVHVVCPTTNSGRHPSRELQVVASSIRTIYRGSLIACQFPATMTDGKGTFTKPSDW